MSGCGWDWRSRLERVEDGVGVFERTDTNAVGTRHVVHMRREEVVSSEGLRGKVAAPLLESFLDWLVADSYMYAVSREIQGCRCSNDLIDVGSCIVTSHARPPKLAARAGLSNTEKLYAVRVSILVHRGLTKAEMCVFAKSADCISRTSWRTTPATQFHRLREYPRSRRR